MPFLAHIDRENNREQSIREHLAGTAELAEDFAAVFDAAQLGRLCGELHDVGKYSAPFQRRIRGSAEKTDHSTAGALVALNELKNPIAAYCICAHHGGLPDAGTRLDTADRSSFRGRMRRKTGVDIADYSAYRTELEPQPASPPAWACSDTLSTTFFTRMLYSCLVDADYLDTEAFMTGSGLRRGTGTSVGELYDCLLRYIAPWWSPKNELNEKRCAILQQLIKAGEQKPGMFTLTVPTGGGKTVASVAFALRHALVNGKRRIIYIIPYTSIIEQTQQVFEEIFGKENVLAHYANVDYSATEDGSTADRRYLAAENWDAPIILTTAVQFFESLYANRSSRCRKLHNIADSVLIFDEAQMLPVPFMRPCLYAISELVRHYLCSAVLCTATQPSLGPLFAELLSEQPLRELCPAELSGDSVFRRVHYIQLGSLSDEALAERLNAERQVLCIVNNRRQAQRIYELLDADGRGHLSTAMTPEHRKESLNAQRERLRRNEPCRLVSTSLIEAGVDIDFPVVYRAAAGLDSMLQAGGRCNREGRRSPADSRVYIFESEQAPPISLRQNISAGRRVLKEHEDIASPEAIKAYFDFLLYVLKDKEQLDRETVLRDLGGAGMCFASVAERFRLIDGTECSVYIPKGAAVGLLERLERFGSSRGLLRELGRYSVGVHRRVFLRLVDTGAALRLSDNTARLAELSLYGQETGLSLDIPEGVGMFI